MSSRLRVIKGWLFSYRTIRDPDAIASGLALKRIAEKFAVKSSIYYGGNIGRHQNRALVNLLETDLIRLKSVDESLEVINTADKVALIEVSLPSKKIYCR